MLIVLHHLAFYGPMSDVVLPVWPGLIHGLSEYGRLAVQLFLVCSGFLTAAGLGAQPCMGPTRMARLAWRRYLRLSIPLMAALSAAVLVTEWVRPHFDHPSLSATPAWGQAVAHVFFLQDLADLEALSTGVWYVAIDFQLYLITLLALWVVTLWARVIPLWRPDSLRLQLILGLTLVSLVRWNLNHDLDPYGLYFFGAYGMGWLAWRARQSRIPPKGWAVLVMLGLLALWVDPRWRIATAWGVALLLAAAPVRWMVPAVEKGWRTGVSQLSRVSYSVFLIHFPVSLAVSAVVTAHAPQSMAWNAMGMLAVLLLSVLAGLGLYRLTEQPRPNLGRWLFWAGVFMASAWLAGHWAGSA